MRSLWPILALLVLFPLDTVARGPEVVQLSPDTYMITRSSKAGMFANMSKLKSRVIQQANDFARRKGQIAIPISENQHRPLIGGFPSAAFRFVTLCF